MAILPALIILITGFVLISDLNTKTKNAGFKGLSQTPPAGAQLSFNTKKNGIKIKRLDTANGENPEASDYTEAPEGAEAAPAESSSYARSLKALEGSGGGRAALIKAMGEDRKHDWLARQLKEEAAAAKSSGLDHGANHAQNCDAKALKASHKHENIKMKDS